MVTRKTSTAGPRTHGSSNYSADVGTRLAALRERITAEPALVVAFSGGVDSALLSVVASAVLGASALAVTAVSPSLPATERRAARLFAQQHGIRHLEICTDEGDRPEYVANGSDRCFHCKSALFDSLAPLADLLRARIALGTNLDDLGEHRPGLAASALHGGIAPPRHSRPTSAYAAPGMMARQDKLRPAADGLPALADLGYANLDLGREARQGLPEVVYAPGKTDAEIVGIVNRLHEASHGPLLVTRVEPAVACAVLAVTPPGSAPR